MDHRLKKIIVLFSISMIGIGIASYVLEPYWVKHNHLSKGRALLLTDVAEQFSNSLSDMAVERGILYEKIPDASGKTIFLSKDVIKIGERYYACGIYGMTDWITCICIYSHDNFTAMDSDEEEGDKWDIQILCEGSEGNQYVKETVMWPILDRHIWGYEGVLYLPSPNNLEKDVLELVIWNTKDPNSRQTVEVKLETYKMLWL